MGTDDRCLLPEGIEEVLPPAARRLELLRRRLLDLYHNWGYDLVVPPLIEFQESLLIGTESDLDLQTFTLYGTQAWGLEDYRNYGGTAWQHYVISVGDYYTGSMGYLVFVGAFGTSVPALAVRFAMIAAGLCLAFPELTSNLIGLAILVPTVIAGRFFAEPKSSAATRV